jgi:hypothetical protein
MGSLTSPYGSASGLRLNDARICLCAALHPYSGTTTARYSYPPASPHQLAYYRFGPQDQQGRPEGLPGLSSLASPIQHGRSHAGTGISTRCPSTTPVGLALGPDLPWADQLDPGTLSQSAEGFLTPLSLLMPAFSLVSHPRLGSPAASRATRRSPTHPR